MILLHLASLKASSVILACNFYMIPTQCIEVTWICLISPIEFEEKRYNCRIVIMNGQILCIRPKKILADSGNYREPRWFSPWTSYDILPYTLPENTQTITRQVSLFYRYKIPCLKYTFRNLYHLAIAF